MTMLENNEELERLWNKSHFFISSMLEKQYQAAFQSRPHPSELKRHFKQFALSQYPSLSELEEDIDKLAARIFFLQHPLPPLPPPPLSSNIGIPPALPGSAGFTSTADMPSLPPPPLSSNIGVTAALPGGAGPANAAGMPSLPPPPLSWNIGVPPALPGGTGLANATDMSWLPPPPPPPPPGEPGQRQVIEITYPVELTAEEERILSNEKFPQAVADYFHTSLTEKRDSALADFKNRYQKIPDAAGKELTDIEIEHRFNALWRQIQFSDNCAQDLDDYFSSLAESRKQREEAKNAFIEGYKKIGAPSNVSVDKLWEEFYSHYRYWPDLQEQVKTHFAIVAETRARRSATDVQAESSKSRDFGAESTKTIEQPWPRINDRSSQPVPIDLNELADAIKKRKQWLQEKRSKYADAGDYFSSEPFLICVMAMKNAKAVAKAARLENPAFLTELRYFESISGFIRFLNQSQVSLPKSTAVSLNAVVEDEGHATRFDIKRSSGKASWINFDSSNVEKAKINRSAIQETTEELSDPFHNGRIYVSETQSAIHGCHLFSIYDGVINSPRWPLLERVHSQQQRDRKRTDIPIKIDATAEELSPESYAYSYGMVKIHQVIINPKHAHLHLEDALFNPEEQTFLSHPLSNKDSNKGGLVDSMDVLRIKQLDELLEYIEELQSAHRGAPAVANKLFAEQVADIRPHWQRDWYQYLPKTQEKFGTCWYLTGGAAFSFVMHESEYRHIEERKELVTELITAIPQWKSSPELRIWGMKDAMTLLLPFQYTQQSEEQMASLNQAFSKLLKEAPTLISDRFEYEPFAFFISIAARCHLPSVSQFLETEEFAQMQARWQKKPEINADQQPEPIRLPYSGDENSRIYANSPAVASTTESHQVRRTSDDMEIRPHSQHEDAEQEHAIFEDYAPKKADARWGSFSLKNKFFIRKQPGLTKLAQSIDQYLQTHKIDNPKQLSGKVSTTIELSRQLDITAGGFAIFSARASSKSEWVPLILTQEDFQQRRITSKRFDELRNLPKSTVITVEINNTEKIALDAKRKEPKKDHVKRGIKK